MTQRSVDDGLWRKVCGLRQPASRRMDVGWAGPGRDCGGEAAHLGSRAGARLPPAQLVWRVFYVQGTALGLHIQPVVSVHPPRGDAIFASYNGLPLSTCIPPRRRPRSVATLQLRCWRQIARSSGMFQWLHVNIGFNMSTLFCLRAFSPFWPVRSSSRLSTPRPIVISKTESSAKTP
jgi:hypothetical protein